MTIIEFFDSVPIHNALSTLLLAPARVILIGANPDEMYNFAHGLREVIAEKELSTAVQIEVVNTKSYVALSEKLEALIKAYPDCAFDLTGGQTEILVAMGALSEKYNIPMHTVDPESGTLSCFKNASCYPVPHSPVLSIGENIALHGGKTTESFTPGRSLAFWDDVLSVWSVCKADCAAWNTAISTLHTFCPPEKEYATLYMKDVNRRVSEHKVEILLHTLDALRKKGILTSYREENNVISFGYKSYAAQLALTKEGSVFELYTYYAAYILGGTPETNFTSAATGVVIDWEHTPSYSFKEDVKNEIDVFLMQGITPVFISCKNGFVDADELYKLAVVAERFGGPYAKKAIALTKHRPEPSFSNRAKELGIAVIENAHDLNPFTYSEKLAVCKVETE